MKTCNELIYTDLQLDDCLKTFSKFDRRFSMFGNSVYELGGGEAMAIKVANHDEILLNVKDVMTCPMGIFDVSYNYLKKREFQRQVNAWVRKTIVNTLNNLNEEMVEYHGETSCGKKINVTAEVGIEAHCDFSKINLTVTNATHLLNHWFAKGLIAEDFFADIRVDPVVFSRIIQKSLVKLIKFNEFTYSPEEFKEIVIDSKLLLTLVESSGREKMAI